MNGYLKEQDFILSLEYISSSIGIELPLTNYNIFRKFLSDKLYEKSMDCKRYFKMIESDKIEYSKFVDAVTINETYFFREEKHFTLLNEIVFPELLNKRKALNIWSAACSTGEEAISLFLTADKFFNKLVNFNVYGSDVNMEVLESFERGIYRSNSFREDGLKFHELVKGKCVARDKTFKIEPELIKRIKRLNLNLSGFNRDAFDNLFDLIFLRNTLIYFSFEKRKKIIDSIVNVLEPGGYLFLSATEMPLISHSELGLMESKGTFYFQKKNPAEKAQHKLITESILQSIQDENTPDAGQVQEPESREINSDQILEYAADKINNRIFNLVRNPDYDMAVKLIKIIYRINNNELEQAELLIDKFENITGLNPISLYLRGYTNFINNKKDLASGFFNKTLMLDSNFWPAGFYLALMLMDKKSEEARSCIVKCIRSIEDYIRKDSYKYQVFLEGFNGKYFLRICEQWLKKI